MEISRFKPKVDEFCYYSLSRAEQDSTTSLTKLNVSLTPLQTNYLAKEEKKSVIGVRVNFSFPISECVLRGSLSQVNTVYNRSIKQANDLTEVEIDEMISPLFSMIQRLTYDVTEIALDQPGKTIDFEQISREAT
ncbi:MULTISPECIES: DUF1149 family protein [Lactobacillales]|uniref:DUF1149 family protein n=1 Tax=Enterococcus gilvus TaxID=160453 RepID=UPI0028EECB07|nr:MULTISPECIES: DUF1149 family protein [Lactobacillales]MDU5512328.1 DUF1149 family protein [Enterococcus gilvus]